METEIFKEIEGYRDIYEISNFGRVKVLERETFNGKGVYTRPEKIMSPGINKKGRLFVGLVDDKKRKTYQIARLVMGHFGENFDERSMDIIFIDGDYTNCKISNLEMVKKNYWSKKQVLKFNKQGEFIKEYASIIQAEKENNIFSTLISACCLGKRKHKTAGGFIWKFK